MSSLKSDSQGIEKSISFSYQARFFELPKPDSPIKHLWLCLHGYGQLAPYFIRKFRSIQSEVHVVVPEGLHRFYLQGSDGRVGASWMTKEARESDISNYLKYLDAVIDAIGPSPEVEISVLGFSQGAATAGRWISTTKYKISNLILWAGMFPHDIDIDSQMEKWKGCTVYSVLGNQDPYFEDSRLGRIHERLTQQGISVLEIGFDGKHEIESKTLELLKDRIVRKT